jgi:hypothetical protein
MMQVNSIFDHDRRYSDRFSINGARLEYRAKDGALKNCNLIDMTKISARFEIDHHINTDDKLEIKIILPDWEKIVLKTMVVWSSNPAFEKPAYAVVQFLPFGTDSRYNSMESYHKLRELEKNHHFANRE